MSATAKPTAKPPAPSELSERSELSELSGLRRVLLLHGIWMVGAGMQPLAARLAAAGFQPEIVDYPSIFGGPDVAVERLLRTLQAGEKAHIVGHSLGGLVAVTALNRAPAELAERIGRVLCLGTPLTGSAVAQKLGKRHWTRQVLGRSAEVLLSGQTSWPARYEVGMIAGSLRFGIGKLLTELTGDHDGTVTVAETRVPALTDHVVIPASHNGLLWSSTAAQAAMQFLRHGQFGTLESLES